jgi:DNA-binding response OmpR family regulator
MSFNRHIFIIWIAIPKSMEPQEEILDLVKKTPEGISITDISERLGHTRATIAKYLEVMKSEGKVMLREVGRAKLWLSSGRKKTILIAEDEPHIRRLIRFVLGEDTYDFHECSDGMAALEYVSETPPDLVILDIMMPIVDGIKVCSQIKKNGLTRSIPIIMLTAKKGMGDKVIGINVGCDDYLSKPFEPSELRARVKTYLDAGNNDRNQITNLPIFKSVKRDIARSMPGSRIFYLFFENLKEFEKMHGVFKSHELIRLTSQLISHILDKWPGESCFGHAPASNNFLLALKTKDVDEILKSILSEFELTKPFFYDTELEHADGQLKMTVRETLDEEFFKTHRISLRSVEIKDLEEMERKTLTNDVRQQKDGQG